MRVSPQVSRLERLRRETLDDVLQWLMKRMRLVLQSDSPYGQQLTGHAGLAHHLLVSLRSH